MCFSSEASFTSSAVLLGIGIASLTKANEPRLTLLACVPVFFCCQQFLEGVLWIALQNHEYVHLRKVATYGFLIFAQVVWPVMVPFTVLALEREKKKRKAIVFLLGIGICIAIAMVWCLIFYPVLASIDGHHIRYELYFPFAKTSLSEIIYLLPTTVPTLISSIKPMRWLGVALIGSYISTTFISNEYLISIWCFFCAIISMAALYIILHLRNGFSKKVSIN